MQTQSPHQLEVFTTHSDVRIRHEPPEHDTHLHSLTPPHSHEHAAVTLFGQQGGSRRVLHCFCTHLDILRAIVHVSKKSPRQSGLFQQLHNKFLSKTMKSARRHIQRLPSLQSQTKTHLLRRQFPIELSLFPSPIFL